MDINMPFLLFRLDVVKGYSSTLGERRALDPSKAWSIASGERCSSSHKAGIKRSHRETRVSGVSSTCLILFLEFNLNVEGWAHNNSRDGVCTYVTCANISIRIYIGRSVNQGLSLTSIELT